MVVGLIYYYKVAPPDDFLRHIRYSDYKPLGGYSYMFPHSFFEKLHFDLWYGFDPIAGWARSVLGAGGAIFFFEALFTSLFILALLVNIKPASDPDLFPLILVALFSFLSSALSRVFLIRPAILLGIIFLFSLKGRRALSGFLIALVGAFLYWLYWLYMVPLAIGHFYKGSRRFAAGAAAGTVVGLIGVVYFSHGQYLDAVSGIISALFSGRGELKISESKFFIHALTNASVYFWVALAALTFYRRRKLDFYFFLIIITLPLALQVRYFADLTFPLLFIYAMNGNETWMREFYSRSKPVVNLFGLGALMLLIFPATAASPSLELAGLDLPKGSVVFTEDMRIMYKAVYHNKEPLRIMPSCELGWNDSETKDMIIKIRSRDAIDESVCGYLQSRNVDYLLSAKPVEAGCLEHKKTFFKPGFEGRVDLWQFIQK